jgi:adenylylsulfate kinase-like enzyme
LVVDRFEQAGRLSIEALHELADQAGVAVHLAVMSGPYLDYVLSGRKTVESRITKNRIAPYGVIGPGDFILFKQSSGPVRAVGLVREALSAEAGDIGELKSLTEPFATGLAYDPGYLDEKTGARYCTLVFLSSAISTPDIPFTKRDRQTWVTVGPSDRQPTGQGRLPLIEGPPLAPAQGPRSTVTASVFLCGPIGAGKSTIAAHTATDLDLPLLAFGDVIRREAASRELPPERGVLQDLGAQLHGQVGAIGLVDLLLERNDRPCVVEGIRHVSVLQELRNRLPESITVFVDADPQTSQDRAQARLRTEDRDTDIAAAQGHEVESETVQLRDLADLLIDTTTTTPDQAAQAIADRIALSKSPVTPRTSPEAPQVDRVHLMATKKIEDGLRSYLDSLGASQTPVVDREAVKSLKAEIKAETDSIAKLRLIAALEEEQAGRVPALEGDKAVFVAEAKAWAEAEGIPVSAFQALKVPDEVLGEAGFTLDATGTRASAGGRSSSSGRAPRIPIEDVRAAVKKLGSGWKLTDLAAVLERDAATARNYVNKLIDEGLIVDLGDDPKHDGRGRAPKLYGAK